MSDDHTVIAQIDQEKTAIDQALNEWIAAAQALADVPKYQRLAYLEWRIAQDAYNPAGDASKTALLADVSAHEAQWIKFVAVAVNRMAAE